MEKKNYVIPQTEQTLVSFSGFLLQTSPTPTPVPPVNPTPGRKEPF